MTEPDKAHRNSEGGMSEKPAEAQALGVTMIDLGIRDVRPHRGSAQRVFFRCGCCCVVTAGRRRWWYPRCKPSYDDGFVPHPSEEKP